MIEAAVEDLEKLAKKNPQAVEWALTKMLLIERDPFAGDPLGRELSGWRKLTVGNRDWRVVWRVVSDDDDDTVTVDVGEVWGVGARSDEEVYAEMRARVGEMSEVPRTAELAMVIDRLAKISQSTRPTERPGVHAPAFEETAVLPDWLLERLRDQVGLSEVEIANLDQEAALDAWADWRSRTRPPL